MLTFLAVILVVWLIIMSALLTPNRAYSRLFDRITRAKYRNDKDILQIMLDNLRSFPEQWSISREQVSFPLQGAKQIYLTHDKTKGWEYSLNSFGGNSRPLDGHFEGLFVREINEINNNREKQSLLRNFYPEISDTLLLR